MDLVPLQNFNQILLVLYSRYQPYQQWHFFFSFFAKSIFGKPAGILLTPLWGTGLVGVQECLPRPLPLTHPGMKTLENPCYAKFQLNSINGWLQLIL